MANGVAMLSSYERSLRDLEEGRVYEYDSLDDLIKEIEKWARSINCASLQTDWLLVWEIRNQELVLVLLNTGTHSDLFGKKYKKR